MLSLKDKTIHGVSWSFADNIIGSGITFLIGLVLARLLSPDEFGIIGMITIFIAISNTIVDSGFSNALIRRKEVQDIDYNTVFYLNIVFSIFLYVIIFISAPAISVFFKEPQLTSISRVIGVILIINAFSIVQRVLLIRKVDFKTQTKISLISSLTSGVIGIGMAFAKFGVWSLVGQLISRQLMNALFLWLFNHWRPKFEFSIRSFKELYSFGSKLLIATLIDTLWKEINYLIIGKFYRASSLGQYTRAQQFQTIFSSNLTYVVQRVSFPVLSSIQDDNMRLKQAYRKIIKTTMLVSFACMLGLAAIAKPLIFILIGEKWMPSVYFLQIMCLYGMLYPLHAINLNMLQVKGRSDLFLKLEIIKKIIAIGPLLLGIFISIEYLLWGSVFTSFIAYYLNSYYSGRLMDYAMKEQLRDILPFFVNAAITALIVWSITMIPMSIWFMLPLQLIVGVALLLILYEWQKQEEYLEIKQIVVSTYNRFFSWKNKK